MTASVWKCYVVKKPCLRVFQSSEIWEFSHSFQLCMTYVKKIARMCFFVPDIFAFIFSNKIKKLQEFHRQFVICSYFACQCLPLNAGDICATLGNKLGFRWCKIYL